MESKTKSKKVWLIIMSLAVCGLLFTWPGRAGAENSTGSLSVDEIVSRANTVAYYGGRDGKAEVTMTITDNQGRERFRKLTILRMDIEDGGE